MTDVTLTIRGDIEVLRLQPGDMIVATLDMPQISERQVEQLKAQLTERFPHHEIVITNGIRLAVERQEATA